MNRIVDHAFVPQVGLVARNGAGAMKTCHICGTLLTDRKCLSCGHQECDQCPVWADKREERIAALLIAKGPDSPEQYRAVAGEIMRLVAWDQYMRTDGAWELQVQQLAGEKEALKAECAELNRVFELQWDADQRAIKMWRQAHPGHDHVWPDRANMVVWMLEQWDREVKP